jgi:hypothetical protein
MRLIRNREIIVQNLKDTPEKLIKKLTGSVCTTGQKNYPIAQKRTAQFSNQFSEQPASIVRKPLNKYHVNDFFD